MVRPRLEYSSTVWDPHLTSDVHTLEQVQRRAARLVHRNYTQRTPGCVTNMVQSLGWESFQHRRYMDRLSIPFKIQHGLVDVSPEFVQPVTAALEDHSAYDSWRPTRRVQILLLSSDDQRLEPSAYISHQRPDHPGTQESPSMPASHTPSSLDPLKLYIVLTRDVGESYLFLSCVAVFTQGKLC